MASRLSTEELLKRLDEQHQAYLETFKLVHEALSQTAAATTASPAALPPLQSPVTSVSAGKRRRLSTVETEIDRPGGLRKPSTYHSSVLTGESDESDEDDELYVQTPLARSKYEDEDLRKHLQTHKFNEEGQLLLDSIVNDGVLLRPTLFPKYDPDEKFHNSHYTIFDVGKDGAPLSRSFVVKPGSSIDSSIWQAIKELNADPAALRPAVGRISIVREPSPIVFGALHLTMNRDFDMDEIFEHLVEQDNSAAHMINRGFNDDQRQQRSLVFKFDYFTVVGEEVEPMPWQTSDGAGKVLDPPEGHIPISRCSSVVALSHSGNHIKKLKNASRRAQTRYGYVYDLWAPWHVLNIQCYPDHKHSMDSHDSTKHYVNGPEAFLHTLLAEFKDAEKRFEEIYNRITKLITPPPDFMFNGQLRDRLLFEDEEFTYSRRYFWAFQTLGIMNNGIKAIIDAYEDTFTDEVWEGKHKTLWPMLEPDSGRNVYWKKKMAGLRKGFQREIGHLEKLYEENDDRRKEIRTLRDQLFSGTSVLESRKSVELSTVTILQGHNIKLLTLVSIFFLPLTFVTSVFGMTNMPTQHQFKWFGIVMATVCIPFFLLIGSLNTTSGMAFWRSKWQYLLSYISHALSSSPTKETVSQRVQQYQKNQQRIEKIKKRSLSAAQAMQIRNAQITPLATQPTLSTSVSVSKDTPLHSNGEEEQKEERERERERPPAMSASESMGSKSITIAAASAPQHGRKREASSWWEEVWGRKRRIRGYEV
ncbi:hypothetical protein LSUB1_G008535 [Lachnellula subtilissima]|uniref:Uncharacterized protein n=1 Tax=Lachnellula subtilissima TaxID=602034 RepID=A0A8H8RB69_9HELO|nr:hypothetical protein LSUB1_G008535 [Lachnellula subtilissima]